jgi:hypothetical protein
MRTGYHLSLSLSRELWSDLLAAALPISVYENRFSLTENARAAVRQLHVRDRVVGLLEDRRTPAAIARVGERARTLWRNRAGRVEKRVQQAIRVEGSVRVELDDMGSRFRYGRQRVAADAYVNGAVEGTVFFLNNQIEIPFAFRKRVGVSLTLGNIHYDGARKAVIGSFQEPALHLGDRTVAQLLSRLGELLLEQQLARVSPVPILGRDQVQDMVSGLGGSLRMQMGVEHMDLEVTESDLTLSVRFGFTHAQIEEQGASA